MSDVSLGPTPIPELTHIMIGLESCSFLVSINLKSFGLSALYSKNPRIPSHAVNVATSAAGAEHTAKQLFHCLVKALNFLPFSCLVPSRLIFSLFTHPSPSKALLLAG